MDLLPQPPPDAPAPPPGPEARRSREKAMLIFVWLPLLMLFAALFLAPFILVKRTPNSTHRTEAISNIKQVYLALIDFDSEYGAFPDASTVSKVTAKTGTTLTLGSSSSNELFRQLIAAGTKSEKIFYAKTAGTPRKPNDILGADALKKGECAFTYIAGLSSSSDPGTPLAMVPMIAGTWKFDPKPFKGKAVVLRIDGSARVEQIDKHGHVIINGMNLFDPRQPYWGGKAPDLKWPE